MLLFKHVHDRDFPEKLPGILSLMRGVMITRETGLQSLEKLIRYLFAAMDDVSVDNVKDILNKSLSGNTGDMIMTIAEQLRKEGFEKGIRQGVQQGMLLGMLLGMIQGMIQGMLEAIELGISFKFGEDAQYLMPLIENIKTVDRLKAIKNAIKIVGAPNELKAMLN